MDGMTRRDINAEIRKLAGKQHGAFTWKQATLLGCDSGHISRRIEQGLWKRECQGVYVLTGSPPTWRRRLKVAQLSVEGSVVCGRSALELHGLPGGAEGLPQLVVPHGEAWTSPMARVHRSKYVLSETVDDFKVSKPEQVPFDVAEEFSLVGLERVVDHSLLTGLTSVGRLEDRLALLDASRLPGIAKMRAIVTERGEGFVVPESEMERRLNALLVAAGVPSVQRQAHPPWAPGDRRRFDALSMPWMVIFEADGRSWHARIKTLERDHRRDLEAAAHGYLTIRLTWAQLTTSRSELLEQVRAVGATRAAA
jgi:very-short-patch-repair endonuclease